MREASQEDALASAGHFFATETWHIQVMAMELPGRVPNIQGTTLEASNAVITSLVPTASPATTTIGTEAGSPRSFLPNGSPSRPTVTTTCRPQTWVQRVSEGLTSVPHPDGSDPGEGSPSGPSSLVDEEVPENLGHQWRVLHPFEIPGVRFPIDTIPPTQRRLAENDALVELIQTTEYLEDMPMWGECDYQLYPLGMEIHSIGVEEGKRKR